MTRNLQIGTHHLEVLLALLTLFYHAVTYNPTVTVSLDDSKYCPHGLLQESDRITFRITINWTLAEERDWKKELTVSTGGVTFCKIAISEDSCSGVYRRNDRCYCSHNSGRESLLVINFTAEAGHTGNKFEFAVTRVDDQDLVKVFKVLPEVYGTPILQLSINNESIKFEPDCKHTFNADMFYKIHMCSRNLNNPIVLTRMLNSDKRPAKITTHCAHYHIEIPRGPNTFELSYTDDCNRTGELRCLFEGYVNETTTKTNICTDCDIQPEAPDWYDVFKWLLPVVIVVAAVSTLIIIVCKVKQHKEREELLRKMSSHRTLGASRSHLSAGRSKSNVGSKSILSMRGSSPKMDGKGSSIKVSGKGSSPKANSKGSKVKFHPVQPKNHSAQSSKSALSTSAKGSSVDSG